MLGHLSRRPSFAALILMAAYSIVASSACVSTLPQPTLAQLAAARETDPGLSLEDLQRGRAVYMARCGNCHVLRSPTEHAPDAWPLEVQRMQTRHQVRLSSDEQRDILRYLRAASQGGQ